VENGLRIILRFVFMASALFAHRPGAGRDHTAELAVPFIAWSKFSSTAAKCACPLPSTGKSDRVRYGVEASPARELGLEGVDNFEKGKSVEVRIPGADPENPVLAHENGCVRVVQQIARQVRKLRNHLPGYIGMSLRRAEHTEPGGGEQRGNEVPRCRRTPWPAHYLGMGRHAQKFVQNPPSGIPSIRTHSLAL